MSKMKAPEGATQCSVAGESYEVDPSGHVTVPAEAVGELVPHGYVPVADGPSQEELAAAEQEQADRLAAEEKAAADKAAADKAAADKAAADKKGGKK